MTSEERSNEGREFGVEEELNTEAELELDERRVGAGAGVDEGTGRNEIRQAGSAS